MREAAEDLLSADPVRSEAVLRWPGVSLGRWQLAPGAVQPGCVAGEQVFGHYPAQVMLADDQQPVTELAVGCPVLSGRGSNRIFIGKDGIEWQERNAVISPRSSRRKPPGWW